MTSKIFKKCENGQFYKITQSKSEIWFCRLCTASFSSLVDVKKHRKEKGLLVYEKQSSLDIYRVILLTECKQKFQHFASNRYSPLHVKVIDKDHNCALSSDDGYISKAFISEEEMGREISHDESLILNGNVVNKLRYLNVVYKVLNTCAFDSIIVGIAVAYYDNEEYRMKINSRNEFLNMATNLVLNVSKDDLYISRFLLLLNYFEIKSDIPGEKYINADCNITEIMYNYLKTDPSSIQISKCTKKCVGEQFNSSPTIILNEKCFKGFKHLENMLRNYISVKSKHCEQNNCKGVRVSYRFLEDHLFIEADMLSNQIYHGKHKLSDFPQLITVAKKKFKLISIIHYSNGHYVTFIRRSTGQWELHNDLQRKIINITNINAVDNLTPHLLMYIKM